MGEQTNGQKAEPAAGSKPKGDIRFVKWFRHWRSGQILRAEDYGIEAFPLGRK